MGTLYEGTWDEIAKHADELRGKQLRLTVLDAHDLDGERPLTDEEIRQQQAAVDAFFEKLDGLTFEPPQRDKANPYGDALAEKYRKQGLDV